MSPTLAVDTDAARSPQRCLGHYFREESLEELSEAQAEGDAVVRTVARTASGCRDRQQQTPFETNSSKPTARTSNLPESFDALGADMNEKFARLAAEVEQMHRELREAEEHSEQLRQRLFRGSLVGP